MQDTLKTSAVKTPAVREAPGFGLLLRATRRRRGLTQEELAARAGMSDRAIRDLERGRVRRPRRATVDLLIDALGLGGAEAARFREVARSGFDGPEPSLVPAPTPLPSQLPPDLGDFVGRAVLVDRLVRFFDGTEQPGSEHAVAVAALAGIGGIGKTSLAVHVAHQLRERFPDGQLYADLRGVAPHPAVPAEVLAAFLRALGAADTAIPAPEEERAALFRSLMCGRRVLVLLDNAHDAAQVRPLLPGTAGCAVIVTSRSRLVGLDGATVFDVDVMTEPEALALLDATAGAARVGAEPAAAAELAALCGRLPLAMRIVGARLATRPGWGIDTLTRRLADTRRRLDELELGDLAVRACFQVTYQSLPQRQGLDPARAFRLLGLFDGDGIELPAAAAMLAAPEDEVERVLEALVDARLLETPRPGRYRFHDLVRLFAREEAQRVDPEGPRREALVRLVRYYLDTVQQANRLLRPARMVPYQRLDGARGRGHRSYGEAMEWLEAEHHTVIAVCAQAAADSRVPAALAARLGAHISSFLEFRGLWNEQGRLAELVLAAARRDGDRHAEALALHELGLIDFRRHRVDEAETRFTRCLELYRQIGDPIGEARALNHLANLPLSRGRLARAISLYLQALEVVRRHGIRRGEAGILSNLGIAYQLQNKDHKSVSCLEDSLVICREIGDRVGIAFNLTCLGNLYRQQRRNDEAVVALWDSLRMCRETGSRFLESEALADLGAAYLALGRADIALVRCEEALVMCRDLGHIHGEGKALAVRGEVLLAQGRVEESVATLRESCAILDRLGAIEAGPAHQTLVRAQARAAEQALAGAVPKQDGATRQGSVPVAT